MNPQTPSSLTTATTTKTAGPMSLPPFYPEADVAMWRKLQSSEKGVG